MNIMEIISNLIAIIALVLSIYSVYNQVELTKASLESEFFINVFREILINLIPEGTQLLRFEDGKLQDFDSLTIALTKLKVKTLYFKFRDRAFYIKLKDKIDEVDDFLILLSSKKISTDHQQDELKKLDNKIEELYTVMFSYYFKKGAYLECLEKMKARSIPMITVIKIVITVVLVIILLFCIYNYGMNLTSKNS